MSTKFLLALQVVCVLLCGYSALGYLAHGTYGLAAVFAALTAYNVWTGYNSTKRLGAP